MMALALPCPMCGVTADSFRLISPAAVVVGSSTSPSVSVVISHRFSLLVAFSFHLLLCLIYLREAFATAPLHLPFDLLLLCLVLKKTR